MKRAWLRSVLRNEFEDGQDGGGGVDVTSQDGGDQQQQQQQQPSAPAFDPSVLTDAVRTGFATALQQQQQSQQQPMTQEQFHRAMMRPEVTDDLLRGILGELEDYEAPRKGMNSFIDGMSQHMQRLAQAYAQLAMRDLQGQMAPLLSAHAESVNKNFVQSVVKKYPTLKGKEQFLNATIQNLRSAGFQPRNFDEAVQQTAMQAAGLIAQAVPGFDLRAQPEQNMPQLGEPMGSSGAPGYGAPPQRNKRPSGVEVFD